MDLKDKKLFKVNVTISYDEDFYVIARDPSHIEDTQFLFKTIDKDYGHDIDIKEENSSGIQNLKNNKYFTHHQIYNDSGEILDINVISLNDDGQLIIEE